jgi:hypothetical protein
MTSDLTIDEGSSVYVTVYPTYANGAPVNLTNATITWVASVNGVQQVKKDSAMMTILLGTQLATTAAASAAADQNVIRFTKISAFGNDVNRKLITDLVIGDIVTIINNSSQEEYCTVASINIVTKDVTMETNLLYTHEAGNAIKRIIQQFEFILLPGDTTLPLTKSYGNAIIWDHMAQATFPEGLSAENIYQEPTTMILLRGKLRIYPILDIV